MKRMNGLSIVILALFLFPGFNNTAYSQWVKGDGNVTKESRDLPEFSGITVGDAFEVIITQGSPQKVEIETDANLIPKIESTVKEGVLHLSSPNIKESAGLKVFITLQEIRMLDVHGAATIKGDTPVQSENLEIIASGAGEMKLELQVVELSTVVSGAADITLTGTASRHTSQISGAASLNSYDLVTEYTSIEASGASEAEVNASKELYINTSGASEVRYDQEPELLNFSDDEEIEERWDTDIETEEGVIIIHSDEWDEDTHVKVGGITVDVQDDDTVRITVGNKEMVINEDGHVEFHKCPKTRFNGHWGGFAIGVNGYVNPEFGIEVPPEYDFLDLKYEQSIDVHLNVYEQNFNLIKNHLGLITGIGFTWNSYRYGRDLHFVSDSATIYAYHGKEGNETMPPHPERNYQKSKLKVTYLNIPLLLEYQTNRHSKTNSFHITAGVVGGLRLGTKSKVMWENDGGSTKEKQWDEYHMQPFRWDAYAGIGWGIINLYATYSLNPLFRENRGPELYPFSVGIALVNW
jgi:hypothetical protein